MASKNQNKPPLNATMPISAPLPSSRRKSIGGYELSSDTTRYKLGVDSMVGSASINGRMRQAFSIMNGDQELTPSSDPPSNAGSEYGGGANIEFTREDVDTLLNERMRYKSKYNYKERCENMMDYIKRLRLCIRWFQDVEGNYLFEQEKLLTALEFAEARCAESELVLKNREEELNLIIVELRKSLASLQDKLSKEESEKTVSDLSAFETRTEFEAQKQLVLTLQSRLDDAEQKVIEGEQLRKKLHNTILELKGNIRVFCRVRPSLNDDILGNERKVVSYPTSLEALGRGIDLNQNGQKYSFSFDQVFTHESSQEDVFEEISQLVQSALDGYKVCIFAYGQTGSGKTYTMMGKPGQPEQKGLIPRTLEQIFQTRESLKLQGWKYEMQVSMLEIYNETIRDLLSTNRDVSRDSTPNGKQYAIKHDPNGNTTVSELTVVDVQSSREVAYLLDRAAHSRSVGKTQMNEQSSRSHFVFTLRITGINESTEQQVQSVLNLIDLAGSERLSKSGSTGDRLRETQAINKSLSSLSDVIFALAKKEDFVPFRNSKLTYLLQPCLGGDSKTLMFVNISPEASSVGESLCSLRFASRVNSCEIGVPRRQTNLRSIDYRLSLG
ncbi:Kinesin-like protein KIN-14N [Linum grandiflorum]